MNSNEYFAISSRFFPQIQKPLSFNLYLQLGPERYTKICAQGAELEHDRVNNYIEKGTKQFFVTRAERRAFLQQSCEVISQINMANQEAFTGQESIEIITDLATQTLNDIFTRFRFDMTDFEMSKTLVDSYQALSRAHPALLPQLLKMAKTRHQVFKHSMMSSIFCSLLAKQMYPEAVEFHHKAGMAGFLHDIGLCKMPVEIDEHNLELNEQHRKYRELHPLTGAEMLAEVDDVYFDVRRAVEEHHERVNGTGYPKKLRGNQISELGRLVGLIEEFSALVGGTRTNLPLPPQMALQALANTDAYDKNMVSALVKLLKL